MQQTVRRGLTAAVAIGLIVAASPVTTAHAASNQADMSATVSTPNQTVASTTTSIYQANVENFGDDLGDGSAASNVAISFVVSGATLVSLAETDSDVAPTASCVVTDAHHGSCSYASALPVEDGGGVAHSIMVGVTGGSDGSTESVSEAITTTSNDPDLSNNTASDSATVVVPPAADLTVSAAPDLATDTVNLTVHLSAGGNPVQYEPITLWAKSPSSPSYVELLQYETTDENGVDVINDEGIGDDGFYAAGPITYQVRHEATQYADNATATVVVNPSPTTIALSAPSTVTAGRAFSVTAALRDADGGPVTTDQYLMLQRRPAGTATWHNLESEPPATSGKASFSLQLSHSADLRVRFISDSPGAASATSAVLSLAVVPHINVVVSPRLLPPGGTGTVSVSVGPSSRGAVRLQTHVGAKWVNAKSGGLSGAGAKSWPIKAGKKLRTVTYRVVAAATATNAAAVSASATLVVERHAGGKAKSHTFLVPRGKGGVGWPTCKAVHYTANVRAGPPGALAMVKEAVRRVAMPTGLKFVFDGTTRAIPGGRGKAGSPLVIAWAHANQTNLGIGRGEPGIGGIHTHAAAFNKPYFINHAFALVLANDPDLTHGFGAGETDGAVLLHELGHAVGLNHTTSTTQIMNASVQDLPAAIYGAGDYKGLQVLGKSNHC